MIEEQDRPQRVLVAGVGYSFLHDWSVGPRVAAELRQREWPEGVDVDVDDWSFGPLDAVYRLGATQPPYRRAIFFGAVERGRPVGSVVSRRWERSELPSPEVVQERIGEAISGVISLDNLVFVCAAFNALPEDVVIIEVEPLVDDGWGDGYSAAVEAAVPKLVRCIETEAARPGAEAEAVAHGDRS